MNSKAPVGIALNALTESARAPEDVGGWRVAVEKLVTALASRESLHAKEALRDSWRARLALDEQVSQTVYEHQATFWAPILACWDQYDYRTTTIVVTLMLWQSQLRGALNVARFQDALSLWPDPDQVPIALAWSDDKLLAAYMLDSGSPGFVQAKHALLLRETQLLNNWVTLVDRVSTPELVAVMETVPFDLYFLLEDRALPLGAKLHAIDSTRAMLATADRWDNEEVDAAIYMFWDRLLPRRKVARPILNRLRGLLVWHASLGSARSRESVEHALEHWPIREEVAKLRKVLVRSFARAFEEPDDLGDVKA